MGLTDALVILDRQHGFKSDVFDSGAVSVVPAPGARETDLTRAYIGYACARLDQLGVPWLVLSSGPYATRHELASKAAWGIKRVAYIACHINAGGGQYGLVKHDSRSSGGKRLATALADALLPVKGIRSSGVKVLTEKDRGWVCLSGIFEVPSTCAALFEPYFIDHADHEHLREGEIIGMALADGCASWLRT